MKCSKRWLAVVLTLTLLSQLGNVGYACGPEILQPIYVFKGSPDPPFNDFVKGNIGIVQKTFGRKTLFISYRYLQGGSFSGDEQQALIDALKGKPPEEDDNAAIEAWIATRKEVVKGDDLPEIYSNRRNGSYDFFPNCTKNAFEVAKQTLRDRVALFGSDDPGVSEWLRGQDVVFSNCGATSTIPQQLGPASPVWLQKDRDYQIGAALFYQMNFADARKQFEKIAEDIQSPWQQTARYLVARTLVREASIRGTAVTQQQLYEQAELYLTNQMNRGGQFQNASAKLLGLVKYRLHPEERVRELAQVLAGQSGNDNLRQDLIDYTWLVDKFDEQVRKAEEERKKQVDPQPSPSPYNRFSSEEEKRQAEALAAGELIQLWFTPLAADGTADYENSKNFILPHDVTQAGVLEAVEGSLGRKLTPKESADVKDRHTAALEWRRWKLNPNQNWSNSPDYEGCAYECDQNDFDLIPAFLRLDELTDWILTFQSEDPKALLHAKTRWRETHSPTWLVAALSKANKTTPGVQRLLSEAEGIPNDSISFLTLAYHRIRLAFEFGKKSEARKLLDQIIGNQFASLPISSQNQFLQQRMALADSLSEFLRYAVRKPVVFYQYGTYGSISQILGVEKEFWSAEYVKENNEEVNREVEAADRQFLPWENRVVFDDETAEMMNWHFSTAELFAASRDQSVPDYLRRVLVLTVWTRSVLLNDETTALNVTSDVISVVPEMSGVLRDYKDAKSPRERKRAAIFAMLKFPKLSPFLVAGVPEFTTSEEMEYYFESAWWCPLSEIDYDNEGNEKPKMVASPGFLNSPILSSARSERSKLIAIGSGKSFLGTRVLEWAKESPDDPRIPEALFVAFKANESYKYGCDSWERDEEITKEAESILRDRYAGSVWTAKLEAAK